MEKKIKVEINKKIIKIKSKNIYQKIGLKTIILLFLIYIFFFSSINIKIKIKKKIKNKKKSNFKTNFKYKQDDLTLITAYYKIKSKHSFQEYFRRLKNLVKLNRSIVFFASKYFINIIKELRPKNLYYKTVFFEMEIKDFYSYKKFAKEFNESFYIDKENSYHTVPLYLVWAEKCGFLKKVILNNYFNSKCFYWIDAGFFVKANEMYKYL